MEDTNVTPFPKEKTEKKDNSLVSSLSPREIVSELDRYVVGQNKAKKAVAIALRNRWRRQALKGEMKNEVLPKNILMIGPTGVGKTEISRRLSKLAEAPFVKVEATRFTEVGYVGRDVEQIIRDLLEISVLPTPVGPIIKIFFGKTSFFISPSSACLLHLFLKAIATAFLALFCPTTNLSNSETISLGDNELTRELSSLIFLSLGTKGVTFEFSIKFLKP